MKQLQDRLIAMGTLHVAEMAAALDCSGAKEWPTFGRPARLLACDSY
jgi:hypothetical protein